MRTISGRLAAMLLAWVLTSGLAAAQGKNKELYLAALKNTIPMYSETGTMDPKGAVLAVFSESSPEVAKANVDVSRIFTNKYVERIRKTTGMNAN